MDYGRLMTAMATPFTEDGQVDVDGIATLVNHLIDHETTTIVVCGTTGESPTLSHDEKLLVIRETLKAVKGRVPVIAGTTGNDTRSSIELSREAEELGVQGLLLVAPYYNKPSQEGLAAHFSAIGRAVEIPLVLYNIPGRCGINISVDTMLKLADELPNLLAIKEASGDFAHICDLAARKPDNVHLYSGDDKFTLPMMALGGYGVVSVASHVVGPEMSQMMEAFVSGDVVQAAQWNGRLMPVFEALFRVSNPAPLKSALAILGLPSGGVRLPLVDAPDTVQAELRRELLRLRKLLSA